VKSSLPAVLSVHTEPAINLAVLHKSGSLSGIDETNGPQSPSTDSRMSTAKNYI